jgi:hypothetical protein
MVVDNLNVSGLTRFPAKTDSPLLIHPDAVLALPVAGKFFQPVPRRSTKILNCLSTAKKIKFALLGSRIKGSEHLKGNDA